MVISASDDDSIARAAAPGGVTQQPPRNGAAPGECRRLPVALKTACMVGIDHGRWHGRHAVDAAENKALIRRFYAEIDAGNIDAMDALVAEDYVDHNPPPFPGLPAGREGLKQAFRIFWEATPGRHEIEDQIAEGDKVVTRLTAYGRHERDLPGPLPATGAEIRETAVAIHRITAGRIVEHWSDRDDLGL